MSFLSSLVGDPNKKVIAALAKEVQTINALEPLTALLTDDALRAKTDIFRERLRSGATLAELLPEAFAVVREAGKRTLGMRHFDVQLMGGMVLHEGKIAEMKTGEGKTLVATLPVYLNALAGKGVHVVTVNDYLARRDAEWMGRIYHFLGLSVGVIQHELALLYDEKNPVKTSSDCRGENFRPVDRRNAYQADITYGTNNEFGFDYLRDNMATSLDRMVQRELHYAIVDEVDSILIDEARTPLIISAPDIGASERYQLYARIVPELKENEDYNVDEKLRAVSLTDAGIDKLEKILGVKNIYEEGGIAEVHYLEEALKAHALFKRDRDYVVREGEIIIVDEFTGRLMLGRRYSEGLHQAIEAKEGVVVKEESKTLATITFQNYFRLYKKLSGMTGTAATEAEEFMKIYKLEVVVVPTNKPMVRKDLPDLVYKNERGKYKAIVAMVKEAYERGQPVLLGTISIEKNEGLSRHFTEAGIPHEILNAKNHEREAEIIAQAGHSKHVTVATNIAGRGVDIILGGNPPDPEDAKRVRESGGLLVLGTERHEARRIDNQLRGRSGRQGDPGASRFAVSMEDDLMRIFGSERMKNLMEFFKIPDDQPIESPMVSRAIAQAQHKVEGHNFDIRKHLVEYDDIVNKQREAIYRMRREILFAHLTGTVEENEGNDFDTKTRVLEYLTREIDALVATHVNARGGESDKKEIGEAMHAMLPISSETQREIESRTGDGETLKEYLVSLITQEYERHEAELGSDVMRQIEKALLMRTIDMLWIEQIDAMERLRESVNLRAYGQRDPLVEYKNESYRMFQTLLDSIRHDVVYSVFKLRLLRETPSPMANRRIATNAPVDQSKGIKPSALPKEPGRNDPCPCGAVNPETGQVYKYKRCGLINAPHHKSNV